MTESTTRREMLALFAVGASLAVVPTLARAKAPPPCPFQGPLDAIADSLLALTPETATYNGVAAALDGGPLARRLDDYSPAGEAAWRMGLRNARDQIASIDEGSCTIADYRFQLATARATMENATRSAGIPYGRINAFSFSGHVPYLVTQIAGPHIDAPNLMQSQQSLNTPAAVDAWIEKLESFGTAFAGVIETLRADEAAGCRPPQVLLAGALSVIDAFLAGPAENHPLITTLSSRMADTGLDSRRRAQAVARATAALDRQAFPAYAALREQVAAMRPRARDDAGLWAQPRGSELYAANVRALGDTALAPEEIHRIGLAEVDRIHAQMDALLRARGKSRGSVGARMEALGRDPANLFADSDAGRAEALEYVRGLIRTMEARQAEFLPATMIPQQSLEVRRTPAAIEAGAPGAFYDGSSLDGSRPGTFWLNLRDMKGTPRFSLPTTAYHEGVPGHHTQGTIALGLPDQPLINRIASFNAYSEGWALYAERLAAELGAYRRDPLGDLGRLQEELHRAVRLVVDTGMHHHRWSRDRAIAYLIEASGKARSEAVAEVERYMAWPGQALGYKLGQLRLLAMRTRFATRKKKYFSRKTFHALVLGNGAAPLDLIEALVAAA